mgnify:CR=1 FL=1
MFIIDEFIRDNFLKKKLKKRNFDCLEIGCSDFRQTKLIKKFYNNVYCIDKFSYSNRKFKNIIYQKSDAESYKIPNNIKDILFLGTIEHLTKPQVVLNKIVKHLKKTKGYLYFSINNKNSLHRIMGYQFEKLKDINSLSTSEMVHGHNFIYDDKYWDNFFIKNNFKFKKDYLMMKILPTHLMHKLYKKSDLIKLTKPKLTKFKNLKPYMAYIFYKAYYEK